MEIAAWTYDTPNKDGSWVGNLSWHKPSPAGCVNHTPLYTQESLEKAVIAEREACAKLCEAMACRTYDKGTPERRVWNEATMDCGETIRMRSNVQIEGLAATKRERSPESSKNRRP